MRRQQGDTYTNRSSGLCEKCQAQRYAQWEARRLFSMRSSHIDFFRFLTPSEPD